MLASILLFFALGSALALAPRAPRRWLWVPPALLLAAFLFAPNRLIASKFIGRLLMPGGLLWLGLIAQSLYQLRTQTRRAALPLVFLLLYTLFGNVYFGGLLLRWLEQDFVKAQYLQTPPAPFDALLILGGGSNITPKQNQPQLAYAGDRIMLPARLYHRNLAKTLVASGISMAGLDQDHDRSLGSETRQIWRDLQIPEEAIIVLDGPRNTKEEVRAYAKLLAQKDWKRVGLVTSAWHMRRAMRLARRAELNLIPVPTDFRGSIPSPNIVGMVPSGQGLYKTTSAAWELLGALAGR